MTRGRSRLAVAACLLSLVAAGAATVGAAPASAADKSWVYGDGWVKYTDSTNKLCFFAYNTEGRRSVRSDGWFEDRNTYWPTGGTSGATCKTLREPEGASISFDVDTYWGERGTWLSRGRHVVIV